MTPETISQLLALPEIAIPDGWQTFPLFPDYALAPTGDVYRIKRARRGRYSDITKPVMIRPSCHPRGLRWYVQLTSPTGKRHRIDVTKLKNLLEQ